VGADVRPEIVFAEVVPEVEVPSTSSDWIHPAISHQQHRTVSPTVEESYRTTTPRQLKLTTTAQPHRLTIQNPTINQTQQKFPLGQTEAADRQNSSRQAESVL